MGLQGSGDEGGEIAFGCKRQSLVERLFGCEGAEHAVRNHSFLDRERCR